MSSRRISIRLLCLSFPIVLLVSACAEPASSAMEPTALASPSQLFQPAQPSSAAPSSTPLSTETSEILTAEPENNPVDVMDLMFPTPAAQGTPNRQLLFYQPPLALGPFDHFYFSQPVGRADNSLPEQDYLYGYLFPETNKVHTGIDIQNDLRTQVVAAAPGRVIWAGFGLANGDNQDESDPYGLAVVVRHDFGYGKYRLSTVYAHLLKTYVVVGSKVKTGDLLGEVGMTGFTTGPHLHFEVRLEDGENICLRNPELWIAPLVDNGLLVGQFRNSYGWYLPGQEIYVKSKATGKIIKHLTYARGVIQSDDYYKENFAFTNLPAGEYSVYTFQYGRRFETQVNILPGAVTYVSFKYGKGFEDTPPPAPDPASWASFLR